MRGSRRHRRWWWLGAPGVAATAGAAAAAGASVVATAGFSGPDTNPANLFNGVDRRDSEAPVLASNVEVVRFHVSGAQAV